MKVSTALAGTVAAMAVTGSAGASPQLEACKAALSRLNFYPGNTSLPYLSAATGHFDLGYSYQNQILAVFPNKVMGAFDMCQTPEIYSYNAVKTHYCALGTDKAGICVPRECTAAALSEGVNDMLGFVPFIATLSINATIGMPPPCAFDPYLTQFCATANDKRDYFDALYQNLIIFGKMGISCGGGGVPVSDGTKVMYAITFILVCLAVIGTLWGWLREKANARTETTSSTISPRLPTMGQPGAQVAAQRPIPVWFKAFDLRDNMNEIFNLQVRAGEFSCFDGLRAISCGWVIIYHVVLWQTRWISNPESLLPPTGILATWWAMPIFNFSGTLCVDTFLFISGFLATFLLLKKLERETRPTYKWMSMTYVNRFARILPAYMFSFFLSWKVFPTIASGPLAKSVWENSNKNCDIMWWRHLLFINTVSPWMFKGAACFGHTWYLANDMIYFYFVPVLCYIYHRGNLGRAFAWLFTATLTFTCIAVTLYLAQAHHWSPNAWDGHPADVFHDEAFNKPYTRCPSYFIGVLMAFFWYEKKRLYPTYKFPPMLAWSMAALSAATMLAIQYGPVTGSEGIQACIIQQKNCGSPWDQTIKTLISGLARPAWAFALGLMCLLCFNGQGGLVNKILSAPIMSPFSFLSYTVYLTHFIILTYYMSELTSRVRWEFFDFVVVYLGLTATSHLLGLFVSLLVEKPAMKLQKFYLESAPAKKAAPMATKGVELPVVKK